MSIHNIARNIKTVKCTIRCILFDGEYFSIKRRPKKANPETKINPTLHSRTKKWFTLSTPWDNFYGEHNL